MKMIKHCSLRLVSLVLSILFSITVNASSQTASGTSIRDAINGLERRVNTIIAATDPQLAGFAPVPGEDAGTGGNFASIIGLEVSTLPIGTSTGAFTFTFDPKLGTFSRSTQTYGPSFGKRSITTGRRRLSAGFNWLHARYTSLAGYDITNGDYRIAVATGLPVGSTTLTLDVTSDTYVGSVAYGLTDRLDVGIGVPVVRVSFGADIGFYTPDGADISPGGHLTTMPVTTSTGVGDVLLFGKYHLCGDTDEGVATEIEVRLPTGDRDNLRGAGVRRTGLSIIWSRSGIVSPHAHVGYEFWSNEVPLNSTGDVFAKNQLNYAFGVEIKAHQRTTLLLDVVGRTVLNGGRSEYGRVIVGPTSFVDFLGPRSKPLEVISAVPGIKWNVEGNVLLTGNILTTLRNQGLRANVIPVVGVEWAF